MIKQVGVTVVQARHGYKLVCIEGANPFELGDIPTNDGIRHPADRTEEQHGN